MKSKVLARGLFNWLTMTAIAAFCALALPACLVKDHGTKKPSTPEERHREKYMPSGELNPEMKEALYQVLEPSQPESIAAACPESLLKDVPDELSRKMECGALRVPQFHDNPDGTFMALSYVRMVADSATKKPLLIIQQGGPGSSSMMLARHYVSEVSALLENFDILAVDQRGTKWTRPLASCPEIVKLRLQMANEKRLLKMEQRCLERAKRNIDLDSISSYQIAGDLNFAAKHFGYPRYSYFGVSYGTLVGSYLLKYHAESLQRTVLDSPVIPGQDWSPEATKNMDLLVKKNVTSYVAAKTKQGASRTYDQTMDLLNKNSDVFKNHPLTVKFKFNNKSYNVKFDESAYYATLYTFLFNFYSENGLDRLIKAAEYRESDPNIAAENLTPLIDFVFEPESALPKIMYQSIVCRELNIDESAEGIPPTWTEMRKLYDDDEFTKIDFSEKRCSLGFERNNDPKVLHKPVTTSKSVLVLGGELDHVTPPIFVKGVSVNFKNAHRAVFDGVGHGVFAASECINKSVVDYLKSDSGEFQNYCK